MRTRAITDEELNRLCKQLQPRDALVLRLARHTGLRISDILSLKSKQLGPVMTVTEQKTGKTRKVYIPKELYAAVRRYIRSERRHVNDAIFAVTRQTVWHNASQAARGLKMRRISAHSCRKAYAVTYAKENGLRATQDELQHDNITTTLLYLTDPEMLER